MNNHAYHGQGITINNKKYYKKNEIICVVNTIMYTYVSVYL